MHPGFLTNRRRAPPSRRARGHQVFGDDGLIDWARRYSTARGQYRVFNAAVYRFYRTDGSPPEEGDTPYATSATLPDTPATTFGDGDWYISSSFYNGVIDSGFLPLGENGETYIRLGLSGGVETGTPPQAPQDIRLGLEANGVVRVHALYFQAGSNRADTWAVGATFNGVDPVEDSPTLTPTMATSGLAVLALALPAQVDGTTVKVRTQARRGIVYSEGSSVLTVLADAEGPTVPTYGESWPGGIAEEA